uniref:Uncharacterized protein n=1 Tax=Trichobilharzia regenti TaxID=157069 RepID=A0AA85JXY9_TRIRE|nr:unnamed protein product [Trichobilharzia regenti]
MVLHHFYIISSKNDTRPVTDIWNIAMETPTTYYLQVLVSSIFHIIISDKLWPKHDTVINILSPRPISNKPVMLCNS